MTTGTAAPTFQLTDTTGREHELGARAGSPATVIVFTCNHCPYALAWHGRIAAVADDYAGRGVEVWCVSSNDAARFPADSPKAMRERVEAEGWRMPYLYDETQDVARAYGARTTPHLYIVDPKGVLVYAGGITAARGKTGSNVGRTALLEWIDGGHSMLSSARVFGCSLFSWLKPEPEAQKAGNGS